MTGEMASPEGAPVRRAWTATALMVALFALLFIPSLLLFFVAYPSSARDVDGWTWVGDSLIYVFVGACVYAAAVLVIFPAATHTLGAYVDRRTRARSRVSAALVFAGIAAFPGAAYIAFTTIRGDVGSIGFYLGGTTGVLPLINYVLVPGLAAFGARLLLPIAVRVRAVRVLAVVLAVVAGALACAFSVWVAVAALS